MPGALAKPAFLKGVQLLLSFISVCAVAEASRIEAPRAQRPGYEAAIPLEQESSRDPRLGYLARLDRQRREAAQQASRQRATLAGMQRAAHEPV